MPDADMSVRIRLANEISPEALNQIDDSGVVTANSTILPPGLQKGASIKQHMKTEPVSNHNSSSNLHQNTLNTVESEEEENVRHQTFQNIVQPLNKHSTGFKTNTDKKNRSAVRFQTLKLED